MNNIKYFLVIQLLISFCLCEISNDQKEKLLNGFIEYYDSLPNRVYQSQERSLLSAQKVDDTTYQIVANVRVAEIRNVEATKLLKCTASIKDSDGDVTVLNSNCEEAVEQRQHSGESQETALEGQAEVSEPTIVHQPVRLDNEVQEDTAITSGEQFIAIPRDQPSAPCVGCASHVNPQAAGVSDLANLGVRHLDLHEPAVKHTLDSVIDVERQVQVVNGVRYILTLSINSNNCTEVESENCASSKTCKITILVKPRVKLSNGENYRAILANNCTEEWLYGDDGEVLPELSTDANQNKGNTSVNPGDLNASDDDIQVKHITNVQSQPNQERILTDDDLKKIQEQIIPNDQFQEVTEPYGPSFTISPDASHVSKQHAFKIESSKRNENSIPVTESEKTEHHAFNINVDKKKAINEMLDFFDFSGFKPKTEAEDVVPRIRRSFDYDLQVLSLAEDFHGIKNSIQNARLMYEMAQVMVDYLNEMDMEVKNRAVKNVIRAEEETENLHRFVYIQARITIPCDKVECEQRDVDTQICNGVIDCSNEHSPQILNTFCYNDNKESDYREDIREISHNDPVLRRMAEEALKKIESESNSQYALRINKIASAITQVTSGTLTKFSVIVENIKCNKSVPLPLRVNCTILEQLGSKLCDVIVHERHWLQEKKISYTCTDRPADMRISKSKKVTKNVTIDDPEIIEMLQEAIQYLESQSDKTNKQKIVSIKSISSQIIAGFLTKIEFVVGYTDCTDENYSRDQINKCALLRGEGLRSCKAQIWDRSWMMDGRQVEVSCDDVSKNNEIFSTRKKRSIDSTSDQEQQNLSKYNDLEYKKLANESLYRFMRSSSSHQHYEVVQVDKAIVQDVSRKLIKIDFSISPTNCLIQNGGILSSSKCDIVNPKNIIHCRSKILENNWIDKKQYFVKCNIKYQKQENTNGLKERNPSDLKYYQLAEESLEKYLHDTDNPHHIIVRVENVTTEIVSGLLTKIDFIISPKIQSVSNSKTVRCHSEILEKHWMGTKAFNVSCQMKHKMKKINDTVKINMDNPKYMQIAVESLQKYIKNKPESNLVRVVFVDKVVQKAGKIQIRFIASLEEEGDGDTLCYAEMSETKESKSDIEVKCYLIGKIFRKAKITEDDPNYYKYVQLTDESLRNYLQQKNSSLFTLVSIESVTVQWDEGIKTLINFTISPIDSENNELTQGKQCTVELLEQPWLDKHNIDVKCELEKDLYRVRRVVKLGDANDGHRGKRQISGGEHNQDPTDPHYKALAEESLHKYVVDSGITQPLKVAQVERVTTQVVAGSLTRIDFLVSGSPDSKTIKCHSEVWEQEWINFKKIDVSCQNDDHRGKRQIQPFGGITDVNPTEPQYKLLAEESLHKYMVDSGIEQPLKVAQVERVTTQIVAGSLTRIDFLVSGSPDSKTIKCHSEVWEQEWINFKKIDVSCQNDDHRRKRQISVGEHNQDPTDPHYKALAEESLHKYVVDSGIEQPLKVAQVERVTTQVVAGSLTRIDFLVSGSPDSKTIKCHSEVWEQGWINFKKIDVSCQNDDHRGKGQIQPFGGITDVNPTEPQYKLLAEESLHKYMVDSGIEQPLKVAQVERVTTQIVAGSLTRIDFLVSGSPDSKTIKCHSEVWEQEWINFKKIDVSCQNDDHRGKRQISVGEHNQDPTDPHYKALAEESLHKYVVDSGITQPLKVAQVERVTTQVVAGSLTRIDFLVSGSPDSKTIKCHSEVWEQGWINFKKIDVSCQNDDHRGKGQIQPFGGITDVNPTEPQYKLLAEESLHKYMVDSGITQPLKVAQVERVTTQVVAGSLTRIDFLVSGSPDSKTIKCHSVVWEQEWINFKKIDVSCQNDDHRGKRQIQPFGGITDVNPTEPQYKLLADESLHKYMVDSGITQPLKVAQVERVTTQVVAGSLTRIDFLVSGSPDSKTIKCHSEVWEQEWINFKKIDVSCQNDDHRGKRQIQPFGGITDVNPTEPQYKLLAEESLHKYMVDSGIEQPLKVAQVERVTTQIVAGSLTRIDFLVSGSPDSKTIKCHSEVWEQEWINFKKIDVSCQNDDHRGKRQISVGEHNQDPTDPHYKALAEESLHKYVVDSGITQPLKVAQVERVTTQVVAGSLTRIDFLVSGSPDSKTIKCHSEVWEQGWINFKKIDVSCQNDDHRGKGQIQPFGGITDVNPTEPQYKLLAEESLHKYMVDSGITQPLKVAQVERVTTQVVAGSLTRIDFLVSGSPDSKTIKCHSVVWEQEWINFKKIDVSCQNDDHRGKRQIQPFGGITDVNPTEPQYKLLADESLHKYMVDSGITQPLKVAQVERVTTQVVAGSLTRIDFLVSGSPDSKTIKCHSEVWEQEWINFKKIDVSCQNYDHRGKRQIQPFGGITDVNPTEPQYKLLADESLHKYMVDSGITQPLKVAQVERVTTQVVAGSLTRIDFLVSGSPDSKIIKCHSEVWEQEWINFKKIDVSCQNDDHRGKRQVLRLGGITDVNPTEPQYKLLAEESLQKYMVDSGITQPLKVAQVKRVTTQVVAGSLTRIDFLVSGSPDSKTIKCHSEIWEQEWINFKKIDVSCQNDNHKGKRPVGGITDVDPTEPQYKLLAEESLHKYMVDSGITQPLKVAQVKRVTTQVVAGSLTRIDFLVSGSPDSKTIKCHSEVLEQKWINFKKIDVSCQNDNHKSKRPVGGITDVDPTEPQYKLLAEESLHKYMVDSGITQPLKVAQVKRVTTQVVAGSLTRIDFLVSGSPDSKTIKCHSEVLEQKWINFKKIDVSCQNDNHKSKRPVGGITDVDPTEPQYKLLAEESLHKYMVDSGITQPLKVAQVKRVTTQVVAGSLTRIDFLVSGSPDSKTIECHSEVWEQEWNNLKKIEVSCQKDDHKGKRPVGGITDVNPTEPQYKLLAEESLHKYMVDSGITQPLKVAQVKRVTTQVVSGSLTRIDFLVSGSPDSKTIECHSEVFEQEWNNLKKIDVSCQKDDHKGKRPVGGVTDVNPTEPRYKLLAEESLHKYMIDSGITQPLKVAQVKRVTTQVVAGSLTRIDFLVSGSPDSKTIECHSEVWEQEWNNLKKIDVSCQKDDHKGKRPVGGVTDVNPTEPRYKLLAEESLHKYMIDSGITQPLKVAQVKRVTTQVVTGLLTHIDFLVSGSPDSKTIKCHSKVWELGWLNYKEINVSCENDGHRGKRQISGGEHNQDPTDPRYKALAEESLHKYVVDSGITQPLKLAQVERVTTQVVAGSLTLIDFLVSGSPDSDTIKCHSKIWEQGWRNFKEINVSCQYDGHRGKRQAPQYKMEEINSKNGQHQVGILRGHGKEEQDPNKPEYKLLAEESLRKLYQKKSTVCHKVVEVQRVVIRVVSGFKYKIDFTAAPTACSVNVSSVRAHSCKADADVLLYCHTDIWDRPWLNKKTIVVQCNGDNDVEEYKSDNDLSLKPSDPQKNNVEKYIKLAEEASEKYLTTSNRKYVHKVTEILSVSEQELANGTLTNIDYSLSPTTCLRNDTTNNTLCKLKQPLVVFNCNANIRIRQLLHVEKEIKVTCKKNGEGKGKKRKRESGVRNIRQIEDDDEEIDEDTIYYYADRAVQHMNDQSTSNNLHKLITIHAVKNSVQMGTLTVKMYIDVAETYCLRHHKSKDLRHCEELNGLKHRLCLARVWPSPDDELVVRHVSVVCDDDENFVSITGVNIPELIRISVAVLEAPAENKWKLVHLGEPQVIPSLDSRRPLRLNLVVAITNCSKDVNLDKNPFQCFLNPNILPRNCHTYIWLNAEDKYIRNIDATCSPAPRNRRSVLDPENVTLEYSELQKLVTASLEQLEMQSVHRYKQRVLQINSHSTKITSGKVTTIDFDVGYTSCLKYEWVSNITSCNFLEHLPRRRCVAQIWERLWINNGRNIDVNCVDDETPLESHIEFESAELANELSKQALKHIEAKYPHPTKQKIVRIFSLEKQVVAGIHYKMKVEVGFTNCLALSDQKDCKLVENHGINKFCRINVWIRPWTDHPPNFRVSCDFQEGSTRDLYHQVQAEHLFYSFLTTYSPSYVNDYSQMHKRFEIFKKNIKKIHEFNVYEKGTAEYGVTRFTDLTYEEFSSTYMGLKRNLTNENQVPMQQADVPNIKIPSSFDWREFDAVTDVKDQGSCGSCWAFSVTGNIEGQWKMQSGQLVSLSEQELVDCDKLDDGCNGGLPDNAYRAIEQMGGLELESDYPYEGTEDKCLFNKTLAKVQISSAVNITANETGMAQWLVHNGPISIGINANAMQFYMGGISHPWKALCNPTNLDHGVLIVGYGVKEYPLFNKKLPYWIVKNSWGKSWGEQGYYRVYRGDGTCGLNKMASSAVL